MDIFGFVKVSFAFLKPSSGQAPHCLGASDCIRGLTQNQICHHSFVYESRHPSLEFPGEKVQKPPVLPTKFLNSAFWPNFAAIITSKRVGSFACMILIAVTVYQICACVVQIQFSFEIKIGRLTSFARNRSPSKRMRVTVFHFSVR
jgi:hypothetical protein